MEIGALRHIEVENRNAIELDKENRNGLR